MKIFKRPALSILIFITSFNNGVLILFVVGSTENCQKARKDTLIMIEYYIIKMLSLLNCDGPFSSQWLLEEPFTEIISKSTFQLKYTLENTTEQ